MVQQGGKTSRRSTPGRDDGRERLQKVLARAGVGSRRSCEQLIRDGDVAVNGKVVRELPVLVDPRNDSISVRGRDLSRDGPGGSPAEPFVYVLLFKPRRTMTTLSDPGGRRTVADLVEHPSGARLYPVGRLDYDTMGLVLMTNDGEMANRLTHPRYGVHKTYRAVVKGSLGDEDLSELRRGIYLADRKDGQTFGGARTSLVQLKLVKREPARTILDITLAEGRNRQVRRMFARLGCPVRKLVRIQMGPLRLKGVRLGEWRPLSPAEVAALRRAAKLTHTSPRRSPKKAATS